MKLVRPASIDFPRGQTYLRERHPLRDIGLARGTKVPLNPRASISFGSDVGSAAPNDAKVATAANTARNCTARER